MTKRFCKMDRREIASQLGEIHQLVAAPKYLCRSCARASSSKSSLCKPQAIPSLKSKAKPLAVKASTLPSPTSIAENQRPQTLLTAESVSAFDINLPSLGKKQLKQAKKALKKQRKYHKKLAKLAKKKVKQLQKREKLEGKLNKYNGILRVLSHKQVLQGSAEQVH
ncbi:hypothetical protein QX226_18260 [Vibrio vulnificus]|uniref:hypothetical protein n=1 Tax=Vibrio vulnificus TaxID=672 RepID=UPI00287ADA96|nr:hypothetical protein [Vibrio vulnificus]MDS1773292.1 hypothetical protein [Vibrio vulnificus]MDS1854447.1 hypothetical protein [Vibrio vulnificus]